MKNEEELNKKQVKEDLLLMSKNLREAVEKIKEVYLRLIEIYDITNEKTIKPTN